MHRLLLFLTIAAPDAQEPLPAPPAPQAPPAPAAPAAPQAPPAPAAPAAPQAPQAPQAPPAPATAAPHVWIFNGVPGDDQHHGFYEKNIASLRKSLTERYGLPAANVRVLYGPQHAGYDGPCTREAMLAELAKVVTHTRSRDAAPAWIILQGHANPVTGGAMFNLPGPDLSMREIGEALKEAAPSVPLVILGTTGCSADLIKRLSGPGRLVVVATTPGDPENETEFPLALSEALAAPESDVNNDGILTVTELFMATNAAVLRIYEKGQFIIKEHAQLDGNGDGKGTQRPAPEDAIPANKTGFAAGGGKPRFE
jgi:hypothetical protein